MAALKALFINPAGTVYGSERSMLALLQARQFEAEVVCPGGGDLERALRKLSIKVDPLVFGKYSLRQNPLWHIKFFFSLLGILRASKPDVLVINLDGNTPLVTLGARLAGLPIVRFSRFEFNRPTRWIDRWCWLAARAVICPSDWVRQQVLSSTPLKFHGRVHRLYDPYIGREASSAEREIFRSKFGLSGNKVIGYVGRLHRGKCVETAIEALAEARKQMPDARLLIIGSDDGSPGGRAYTVELQNRAAALDLAEAVTFTGYVPAEEMPAAIGSLDVCVLPSKSESLGMVLMEAWAQGVPTVASNVGGCREITLASDGGCLAPVGDTKAFAEKLQGLLTDPESATALGQKGKAWVDENCAPSSYAREFVSVINDVIQVRPTTKLTSKVKSVASNPIMLFAYLSWIRSKIFAGKSPRLTLPGGAQIGEWTSFSEYWSFQKIVPESERLFVERCLTRRSEAPGTAFDLGANVGIFTCMIASHGHTVHSFEPIPDTFRRLTKNVKFNGLLDRTFLNCLAVGKEQGMVTFQVRENAAATNRMASPEELSRRNATSVQSVRVTSLDNYCETQGVERIDFVKVDVEGMEPYVLQGARTLLKERRVAAILIEVCPVNLRAVGFSPSDLYREFENARYSPYALTAEGRPGAKLSLAEIEAISLANVVLLPDA